MKIHIRRYIAPVCLCTLGAFIAAGAGCGGGGGGGGSSTPSATATPRPTVTPTPTTFPTQTPGPTPTPIAPPAVPFDIRGAVLLNGVGQTGVTVTATGSTGAVTPSDRTVSGAGGSYSFLLGAGTYTLRATLGTRSATRVVTVPPGGRTVDNVQLNL